MIKTLLYPGVRVSELVRIRTADVDLDGYRIRINQGKGAKDRYVPYPAAFKETLALHSDSQRRAGASHSFESSWKKALQRPGGSQDPGALRHRRRHRGPDQPPPTSPLPVHLAQDPGDRRRPHPALLRPRHPSIAGDLLPDRARRRPTRLQRGDHQLPRLNRELVCGW
jgi:integrase